MDGAWAKVGKERRRAKAVYEVDDTPPPTKTLAASLPCVPRAVGHADHRSKAGKKVGPAWSQIDNPCG